MKNYNLRQSLNFSRSLRAIGEAILFLSALLLLTNPAIAKTQLPSKVAIATADPLATQAGLEVLKKGGNAFDAAIAVSAALAVVEPFHSGIGGGGFWLLHDAKNQKNIFVDGREQAPLTATPTMYQDKQGNVIKGLSLNGPLSAGIPGEPAALAYIAKHYGRLSLAEDLAPAIRLAKNGFKVNKEYVMAASYGDRVEQLQAYPSSAKIFLKNNQKPELGDVIVQKDLAKTLEAMAKNGHDGFYKGEVAKKLVDGVNAAGGRWSLQDLKNYQVHVRQPLVSHYHDMKIITAPPPSAGGIAIVTILNILAPYDLVKISHLQRLHVIIEAMRMAYWDRSKYLGDPAYVKIPMAALTSMAHANQLRSYIHPDKATPSNSLPKRQVFTDASLNTTHFSIIDQEGNRVAATLSVNFLFGSSFTVPGTGVLLNDEMDDFSSKPGSQNVFGIVGNKANQIEPGKRPLSSMSPTFVETKDKVAVLGTPGGSRIPTMVLLGMLEFAQNKGPSEWVSVPRFHMQYIPDEVMYEQGSISAKELKLLKAMGYKFNFVFTEYGDMQAVLWNKKTNRLSAASDPRGVGSAKVVRIQPATVIQ